MKNMFLVGVYHALPELGSKEIYLINESISGQILDDFSEMLMSPKTLIISEDANIPTHIHHCKCGACKPEGESRLIVLQNIFGKQHNSFLKKVKADVVIADIRQLKNGRFSKYVNICNKAITEGIIKIENVNFFRDSSSMEFENEQHFYNYIIQNNILTFDREKLKELFADYLSEGTKAFDSFRRSILANDCDETLVRSIELHMQDKCEKHSYDTLIVTAGSMHCEGLDKGNLIKYPYKYHNYGFTTETISQEIKDKAKENITSYKLCFNLLLLPNETFLETVFS